MDEHGNATLGGFPVEIKEGYVRCLLTNKALPIPQVVEFVRRLREETGCAVIDRETGFEYYRKTARVALTTATV